MHVLIYYYRLKSDEEFNKLWDCKRHVDTVEFISQKSYNKEQAFTLSIIFSI